MDNQERPKLRMIEALPVELQGRRCIVLRDPAHMTAKNLVLPIEVGFMLKLINGTNKVLDLKAEFVRGTGFSLSGDTVEHLLDSLDENLMLDNERFQRARGELEAGFKKDVTRKPFHAGVSYPTDSREIVSMINDFYQGEKGPGALPPVGGEASVNGLAAPHIDMRAGGPSFAWAYHALAQSRPPERFVILGTGHQGTDNLFALTAKNFETPLGMIETDKKFVEHLASDAMADYFKDEILHRTEHVIEFQLLFLQHLYGDPAPFSMVPILCSFDPEIFFRSEFEPQLQLFQDFTQRLRRVIAESPGSTCLIASVDLDHVGPRYGDPSRPTQGAINESLEIDRELLGHLEQGNDREFLSLMRRINSSHRICGFSPLYTMMKTMPQGRGRLLHLDYTTVDDQNSFVSFAAMAFFS